MLVCQCKWLTYKQISDVVEAGADSVEAVQKACGAGTECGGCVGVLMQFLEAHKGTATTSLAPQADVRANLDSSAA